MPCPAGSTSITRRPPLEPCAKCHTGHARQMIGGEGPFCHSCADELIAAATGWPRLEGPPPPDTFRGADGIEHRMVYSVLRTPGGIEVLAEEDGWAVDEGSRLALLARMTPMSARCSINCAGGFGMQSASSISIAPRIARGGSWVVWTSKAGSSGGTTGRATTLWSTGGD